DVGGRTANELVPDQRESGERAEDGGAQGREQADLDARLESGAHARIGTRVQPVVEGEGVPLVDLRLLARELVEAHHHDDEDRHERVDEHQDAEEQHQVTAQPPHSRSSVPENFTYMNTRTTIIDIRITDSAAAAG